MAKAEATTRSTVLAARSIRDLHAIERKGILAARSITVRLRAKVLAAFRSGGQLPDIRQWIEAALLQPLTQAMVASHTQGVRRSQLLAKSADHKTIKASVFDDVQAWLQRMGNVDLAKLQKTYGTEALKILNRVSTRVQTELQETMYGLISEGAHTREGIDVLRQKFDRLGLSEKNGFQLETIFRTQSQLAYGAGRWAADQDEAVQEILWGYEYSAVGDNRTRPTHLALDGTRLPKDDPFWKRFWPPNGWNCRCQAIPIFEPQRSVRPPRTVDGDPISPDKGFAFNAGELTAG